MAAGVVAGSAVGSVAEELTLTIHRLWAFRLDRVEHLAERAAAEAGIGFDQIISDVSDDGQKLELLGITVRAASEALDRRKIDLLAHVFVRDVWDCAAIDEAQLLLDAIRQIEALDLRLLRVLKESDLVMDDMAPPDPGFGDAVYPLIARLSRVGMVYDVAPFLAGAPPTWRLTKFGGKCVDHLRELGSDTAG